MKTEYKCKICENKFFRYPQKGKHLPTYCSRKCKTTDQNYKSFQWKTASYEEQIDKARENFEKMVIKKDGCWDWKGYLIRGYGQITAFKQRRAKRANIVSWLIHKGPIPKGMFVLHKCDNRECTNPEHLFLGTHKDNMCDMVSKNRQAKGSKQGHAKLNEEQVRNIKNMVKTGKTDLEISEKYQVTRQAIYLIRCCKNWKHV